MRYLWLLYFPLLFLPNLGFSQATGFGTLEFSDFLIGPYLVLVLLAAPWGKRLNVGRLTPWMGVFVAWAILSTVTISLRYGYVDNAQVDFGMFKIAKMVLYGLAGVLTARALAQEESRRAFDWSLLAAVVVTGVSLWSTRVGPTERLLTSANLESQATGGIGYGATNGISVMGAILMIYLGTRWITGHGTALWRIATPIGLVMTVGGMAVSNGRGGWLAALAGAVYLVIRLRANWRLLALGGVAVVVILGLYQSQPTFRSEVDKTIFMPTEEYGYQGSRPVGTVDDGYRLETWTHEAAKLDGAPILGTGMYHRGGLSGLWESGSHNFWLQMLLELGIVGGGLLAVLLALMWRQATGLRHDGDRRADVSLKAAIITAFAGGLSGEYFYGGIILFTLFAVYAQTGGMPIVREPRWQQVTSKTRSAAVVPARTMGAPGD